MLPSLGELFGLTLYTYPLFMGLAWGFAFQMGSLALEKSLSRLMWNFFFWGTFVSAWLGAKLLFLLVSEQNNLLTNSNFWLGGGLVFYGGLIGALIFILAFCLSYKKFNWTHLAYLVPILMFSHGLGRIGCFCAGCCYGKEMEHFHFRHPVQLYEAFSLIGLAFVLNHLLKKKNKEVHVMGLYFLIYAFLRFILEFLRDDTVRGIFGKLSTSQWISLLLLFPGFIFIFLATRRKTYGL